MQTLTERTEGAWRPSPGAVYPALAQLEDEGLIESFDNEGQKALRLTESGQQAAAGIDAKPWEVVNQAVADWGPDQLKELWQSYAGLAGPLRELSRNGSSADVEAATRMLEKVRRRIYGLLAADEVDDSTAEDLS